MGTQNVFFKIYRQFVYPPLPPQKKKFRPPCHRHFQSEFSTGSDLVFLFSVSSILSFLSVEAYVLFHVFSPLLTILQ